MSPVNRPCCTSGYLAEVGDGWHTHHTITNMPPEEYLWVGGGGGVGGLTFGLSPSMLSCVSCARVCSRTLFSTACCRRSFIRSKVSSSGCKGGEVAGRVQPLSSRDTVVGGGKRREHTRIGDASMLPASEFSCRSQQ